MKTNERGNLIVPELLVQILSDRNLVEKLANGFGVPSMGTYNMDIAAGSNVTLLADQVKRFRQHLVAVRNEYFIGELKEALADADYKPKIFAGEDGVVEVGCHPDAVTVVTSIFGCAGWKPTMAAIEAGEDIALANKDNLIAEGPFVLPLAHKHNVKILPVDSEHSAIFQCIQGLPDGALRRILLTASDGAFRDWPVEKLKEFKVAATLFNKGLEVMEAHFLFGAEYDNIEIIIHLMALLLNMDSLPETVEQFILAHLSNTRDLASCKCVSRQWNGSMRYINNLYFPRNSFENYLGVKQPDNVISNNAFCISCGRCGLPVSISSTRFMIGPSASSAARKALSYYVHQARKYDYHHYLCLVELPSQSRMRKVDFALRAFNVETARDMDVASDSKIGLICLLWWQDTLDNIFSNKPIEFPTTQALSPIIYETKICKTWLKLSVEAQINDSRRELTSIHESMEEQEQYAADTMLTLFYSALQAGGIKFIATDHAAYSRILLWLNLVLGLGYVVCCISKFLMFSLSRSSEEVDDLEDKVIFKGRGMMQTYYLAGFGLKCLVKAHLNCLYKTVIV